MAAAGDKLETGKNVLIHVEGEAESDAVKVRLQAVQTLDDALGSATRQIKITATGQLKIAELAKRLEGGGQLQVTLALQIAEAQSIVELDLGSHFRIVPRHMSELKTLPGLLRIHEGGESERNGPRRRFGV